LKIDKSFIKELGQDNNALTLTRTIVNLGHNLGLQVTAEGVETQAQLVILQNLGCDHIQGYLISRPASISAFADKRDRKASFFEKKMDVELV
jgi:EAL domain-containing protein (putative c-di-GMP-specific phosphodiesterase class I)